MAAEGASSSYRQSWCIPGKTGTVYTLYRRTGEFPWARPTVAQNVSADIDGSTGAVTVDEGSMFSALGEVRLICPSMHGGKDWEAGAYSPLTNLMYFPLRNACMPTLRRPPRTRRTASTPFRSGSGSPKARRTSAAST